MTKTTKGLETNLAGNTGWILILLLVAGSSFLLGSSARPKATTAPVTSPAPTSQPTAIGDISSALQDTPPASDATIATSPSAIAPTKISGIVNINTGSEAELESLPGIGPSKAKAIIDYRQQNGPFVTIEDIEKVKGIGPKTFDSLKSKITI